MLKVIFSSETQEASSNDRSSSNLQLVEGALIVALFALAIALQLKFFRAFAPTGPRPFFSLKETFGAFLLFISIQFVFFPLLVTTILLWGQGIDHQLPSVSQESQGWWNISAITVVAASLFAYCYLLRNKTRLLFASMQPIRDITIGISTWLIAYPLVVALSQFMTLLLSDYLGYNLVDQTAVKQIKLTYEYKTLFIITTIYVIFIVPLLEELLFRGFLQTTLKNFVSPILAILITSTIFALFHFSLNQGMNNLVIISSLFLLSLFLGYLRERQGNIISSYALHSCFNALSVLMIFIL